MWNSALPKRYSVTCWKALNFCLSVDTCVKALGIPMVSKCECCVGGSLENQDHVLSIGTVAKEVWRCASVQLGIPFVPNQSWKGKMELWFRRANHASQIGPFLGFVPVILTWARWVWGCKARMEGKRNSVESLWLLI